MTSALEVLATGPLVLVEDDGRPGFAAIGVGRSGAADRTAYRLGARLVGNGDGRAALEVLLGGLSVRARGRVTVALTGAPAPAVVDGRPVGHATLVDVPEGSVLTLGMPATSLRTYLTVRGGIDVAPVIGSRSTDTLSGLGPAPVRVGDVLPIGMPGNDFPTVDQVALPDLQGEGPVLLEVLPGPRPAWVGGVDGVGGSAEDLGGLLRATWVVAGEQRPGRHPAHRRAGASCTRVGGHRAAERGAGARGSAGAGRWRARRLPRRPPRDRRLPRRRRAHGIRGGPGGPAEAGGRRPAGPRGNPPRLRREPPPGSGCGRESVVTARAQERATALAARSPDSTAPLRKPK